MGNENQHLRNSGSFWSKIKQESGRRVDIFQEEMKLAFLSYNKLYGKESSKVPYTVIKLHKFMANLCNLCYWLRHQHVLGEESWYNIVVITLHPAHIRSS
jgi:hypothetical protein